ncbi:hypothetical protein GTQ40_11940 [Flavobacteriaceae bacterium R38]|nr:hypothetical protein [Flavobacteriaceae bacterium R38]
MRKLFAFFLVAILFSCNVSDDGTNFDVVKLGVEPGKPIASASVNIPFQIPLTYSRPSSCHFTDGFIILDEDIENNTFTFALAATFIQEENCETLVTEKSQISFPFVAKNTGNFKFLFWKGEDENGLDEFLTIEVTVK